MSETSRAESNAVLYSFRRCPYAMRARLAILAAGFQCELREIVLRDKAPRFLDASAKGIVPVLVLPEGLVLEESLEIMAYVLARHDPFNWLPAKAERSHVQALIEENDGPFKAHLDRTKYANRFLAKGEQVDVAMERQGAMGFITRLDQILGDQRFLGGPQANLADMAILPFVRQFAHIDMSWFRAQPIGHVINWLDTFLTGKQFSAIMSKYPKWEEGQPAVLFP